VIEFETAAPVIVDRALYRELAKQAIKRTVEELRAKAALQAEEKRKAATRGARQPADPVGDANRERDRQLRELGDQAHGVNLDLGAALLHGLARVDPADVNVARFFVYSLLGSDYADSPYTQAGERVARLAASGIRLVIGEFRADVTMTRKDGSRGRLRIDYGDPRDPAKAVAWLWKFVDAGTTAADLYGRALVVIWAEQHASRLVVPVSQRSRQTRWGSHHDLAAKALAKLAGPHLPASLKQLEKAIERVEREHGNAERRRPRDAASPHDNDEGTGEPESRSPESGEDDLAEAA
jgi:hypothetical protein